MELINPYQLLLLIIYFTTQLLAILLITEALARWLDYFLLYKLLPVSSLQCTIPRM